MLNTRILMVLSALFLASLGLTTSLLPQEILAFVGAPTGPSVVLIVQIAGALYLGFAFLNWMARGNLIGGIYSRPVAMGNFLHFVMVAFALWKAVATDQDHIAFAVGAGIYTAFAIAFGTVLFTSPRAVKQRVEEA